MALSEYGYPRPKVPDVLLPFHYLSNDRLSICLEACDYCVDLRMPQRNRGGTLADLLYKAIRTPSAVRSSPSHLRPLFTSAPVTKPVHPLPSSFVSHRPHGPSHRQSQYELQGSALGPSGHRRAFSTTPSHHKKRDKKLFVKSQPDELVPDNKAEAKRQQEIDPYDYSELQKGIDKALDSFKNALSKTRNAGRVTVEMIEALPLELKEGKGATEGGSPPAGGAEKHKMKLGDIATVVARGGRTVQVIATEEGVGQAHVVGSVWANLYST